jgi:hypothetical protein
LEDNIKIDIKGTRWGVEKQILLYSDSDKWRAFVNMAMNFQISIKCWEFLWLPERVLASKLHGVSQEI